MRQSDIPSLGGWQLEHFTPARYAKYVLRLHAPLRRVSPIKLEYLQRHGDVLHVLQLLGPDIDEFRQLEHVKCARNELHVPWVLVVEVPRPVVVQYGERLRNGLHVLRLPQSRHRVRHEQLDDVQRVQRLLRQRVYELHLAGGAERLQVQLQQHIGVYGMHRHIQQLRLLLARTPAIGQRLVGDTLGGRRRRLADVAHVRPSGMDWRIRRAVQRSMVPAPHPDKVLRGRRLLQHGIFTDIRPSVGPVLWLLQHDQCAFQCGFECEARLIQNEWGNVA